MGHSSMHAQSIGNARRASGQSVRQAFGVEGMWAHDVGGVRSHGDDGGAGAGSRQARGGVVIQPQGDREYGVDGM